jgi:hypothetical protein
MSGGMNKKFQANPIKFMKTYAICPPDDIANYQGDTIQTMHTSAGDMAFADMDPVKRVAWINLEKKPKAPGAGAFMPLAEKSVTFTGSYTGAVGKFQAYFLPWSAAGAIIKMTIPDKATLAPTADDSNYFFTATITGCSIFVKGPPNNPTVYHAGGETKKNSPRSAARFWRNLLDRHDPGAAPAAKVDKRDYIRQPNVAGGTTTQAAVDYENWLNGKNRKDLQIQFVEPWGCVMGLRDNAGNWKFYLQRNATVYFFTYKWKVIGPREKSALARSLARPMEFEEIYPGGPAGQHVRMQMNMPSFL